MATQIRTFQKRPPTSEAGKRAADHAFRVARLAAEKAVAHTAQAATYKMAPETTSLEHLFLSRFQRLSAARQQAATARVMGELRTPTAARTAFLGALATVNLAAPKAVALQARRLVTRGAITLPGRITMPPTPPAGPKPTTLELRVHRVTCVDETGGGWGGEWGDDEIDFAATIIDENADVEKVPRVHVADFAKDGDIKQYAPPMRALTFDLREGGDSWPKSYFAVLVLAERDQGDFPEWLNSLVTQLRGEVAEYLITAGGAAIGSLGGPVGTALGAVIGEAVNYCLDKVLDYLRAWWGDDVFPPVTVSVEIPSANATWNGKSDSPEAVAVFAGHDGRYDVTYDWRAFA